MEKLRDQSLNAFDSEQLGLRLKRIWGDEDGFRRQIRITEKKGQKAV
jgi:hypothetical protein